MPSGGRHEGGVVASPPGTLQLLEPEERCRIAVTRSINFVATFRCWGRASMMALRLGVPCAGAVPYLHELGLDEEDGVASRRGERRRGCGEISRRWHSRRARFASRCCAATLNFTDFDPLPAEPAESFAYVERPEESRSPTW